MVPTDSRTGLHGSPAEVAHGSEGLGHHAIQAGHVGVARHTQVVGKTAMNLKQREFLQQKSHNTLLWSERSDLISRGRVFLPQHRRSEHHRHVIHAHLVDVLVRHHLQQKRHKPLQCPLVGERELTDNLLQRLDILVGVFRQPHFVGSKRQQRIRQLMEPQLEHTGQGVRVHFGPDLFTIFQQLAHLVDGVFQSRDPE
eukprot:Lithocolla_globosa_v1_NODE_3120_length_1760_cov_3.367742.p2 type:complete len:198 gc:universal NODE_3120_length_1760_cov_3.367742:1246-653(-)